MRKHKIYCFLLGLFLSLCFLSQYNLLCVNTPAKAIDLPSGGHFMTVSEALSYIGESLEVTYYDGTDYQTTSALYQTSTSRPLTETSESPVGFVSSSGVPWLVYSFNPTRINTSPNYITVQLRPTYSIFDTNYLYTCVALSAGSNSPSNTYTSPSCDWYIAGSINHFENSSDSTSSSGRLAYLSMSGSAIGDFYYDGRFTYVPIVHSSASAFSAYCMSCDFNGNSYGRTLVYYFLVMCPYVSGSASGGSGTFASGTDFGNININIDMSETNSLLGDILNGVAPISELVDLLSDDVDIPTAGTVVNMPYDNEDYDNMIMTADAILDDIPDTVAAASFWVEITNAFFPENSWLRFIMPLLMIMALMAWLLWKK